LNLIEISQYEGRQELRQSDKKLVIILGVLSAVFLIPVTIIGYLNPAFADAPGPQQYVVLLGVMFLVGFVLFLTRPPKRQKPAAIPAKTPNNVNNSPFKSAD